MSRYLLLTSCVFLLCLASLGHADWVSLANGGFEDGLNDWTTYTTFPDGGNLLTTSEFTDYGDTITPYQGSQMLQLSAWNGDGVSYAASSQFGIDANNTIGGVFQTVGGGNADANASLQVIDVGTGGTVYEVDPSDFSGASGWVHWSYTAPVSEHVLVVYELDGGDTLTADQPDYMLVDSNDPPELPEAPEPGSLVLGLGALGMLGGVGWRRRRR